MRALIDEDVHIKILKWLTDQGHDVIRVPLGFKNGKVLELATQEARILITRDKDFSDEKRYPPLRYKGIVVLRVHPPEFERLVSALKILLEVFPYAPFQGKLVLAQEKDYHVSPSPPD